MVSIFSKFLGEDGFYLCQNFNKPEERNRALTELPEWYHGSPVEPGTAETADSKPRNCSRHEGNMKHCVEYGGIRKHKWFQMIVLAAIVSFSIVNYESMGIKVRMVEIKDSSEDCRSGSAFSKSALTTSGSIESEISIPIKLDSDEQQLFNIMLQMQETGTRNEKDDVSQLAKDIWGQASHLFYSDRAEDGETAFSSKDPIIIGKEQCEGFRHRWGRNATVGIASMFNSGSNALTKNLRLNLGIHWINQSLITRNGTKNSVIAVPWWKHNPIINDELIGRQASSIEHASILPIVIIRDPYFWRNSMCTAPYRLKWDRVRRGDCPKFWYENDTRKVIGKDVISFLVSQKEMNRSVDLKFASLFDLWNTFYDQYLQAPFPRLIVRFEDTLFRLPQIIQFVHECVGAYWKGSDELLLEDLINSVILPGDKDLPTIRVYSTAAKIHGNAHNNLNASSLVATMKKNTNATVRLNQMNRAELAYARLTLDPSLMQLFGYLHPFPP